MFYCVVIVFFSLVCSPLSVVFQNKKKVHLIRANLSDVAVSQQ